MADQLAQQPKLNHPWMVAVWPGMGGVALNAGFYLLAKMGMRLVGEYDGGDLFDTEHVEVKDGIIQPAAAPRNRFFLWTDPEGRHDLVLFVGEAQPTIGKHAFCRRLVAHARELGVERVFTFAALATEMRPDQPSRVFGAATDPVNLAELKRLEVPLLQEGNIGGLNGLLLATAAEAGLHGACLLGEMPQMFVQLPNPKAALAILEVFTTLAGITVDLGELAEQARGVDEQLTQLLSRVEQANANGAPEEEVAPNEVVEERKLPSAVAQKVEVLFEQAARDRSKALELKQELDRLAVFKDYEDRFLDLFKKEPGSAGDRGNAI